MNYYFDFEDFFTKTKRSKKMVVYVFVHTARKEFDAAVKGKVGDDFKVWDWGELLGLGKEVGLREVRERKVVSRDGVHLERNWNRRMAANIGCRIAGDAVSVREGGNGGDEKKGKEEH
jgi:hypothetical protein